MIENFNLGDEFLNEFNINKSLVEKFTDLSNDKNPLHIDNEVAKKKGFKSRVVYGNLLNCFISFFVGECLPSKDVIILSQTIKFTSPVFINDNLFFSSKIIGVFKSVNVVEFSYSFKNQSGELVSKGKINIKVI